MSRFISVLHGPTARRMFDAAKRFIKWRGRRICPGYRPFGLDHLGTESMDVYQLEGICDVARMLGPVQGSSFARVPIERLLCSSHAPYFALETEHLKRIEPPLDIQPLRAIKQDSARRMLPKHIPTRHF